jgi:hypothetical protein
MQFLQICMARLSSAEWYVVSSKDKKSLAWVPGNACTYAACCAASRVEVAEEFAIDLEGQQVLIVSASVKCLAQNS